jgi:hypothetical protein
MDIVKRRLIEERRDRLAQSIEEAREEYKRGKIRKGTVDDLMHELSKWAPYYDFAGNIILNSYFNK